MTTKKYRVTLLSMRAAVVEEFGDDGRIEMREIPTPDPGPGELRVRVAAAGINPVDTYNVIDPSWAGLTAPCVLGYDIAGTVDAVGPGVAASAVGRPVMAMTPFPRGQGGYAEFAVIDQSLAAFLPESVDLVAAASIPLAAGTAWEALQKVRDVGPRVLVLGASGGVGLFVLQLASAAGKQTVAVGRERNHDVMTAFGASSCVDYQSPDAMSQAAELAGGSFDAIIDLVGGSLFTSAHPLLRDDGVIAAVATSELDVGRLIDANQSIHGFLIRDDGDRVRRLAKLFSTGRLQTHVTHVLPLAEVGEAHRLVDSGEAGGKVVLTP
jgi:NADPH2:quinone reductase